MQAFRPAVGASPLVQAQRIAVDPELALDAELSPDAKRVTFVAGTGTAMQLYVANLDGTGARAVGPAADRVIFSPDGAHLLFEAQGFLWVEAPEGPPVTLDELGRVGRVIMSGSGDRLLYSVFSGERRGTFWLRLRTLPPSARLAWVVGS